MKKAGVFLIFLNAVVLLGQLWPKGAPPFARIINIVTLCLNLLFLFKFLSPKR